MEMVYNNGNIDHPSHHNYLITHIESLPPPKLYVCVNRVYVYYLSGDQAR